MYGIKELASKEGLEWTRMLEKFLYSDIVPGICVSCGFTKMVEPDQCSGICDKCKKKTIKSCFVLVGIV